MLGVGANKKTDSRGLLSSLVLRLLFDADQITLIIRDLEWIVVMTGGWRPVGLACLRAKAAITNAILFRLSSQPQISRMQFEARHSLDIGCLPAPVHNKRDAPFATILV